MYRILSTVLDISMLTHARKPSQDYPTNRATPVKQKSRTQTNSHPLLSKGAILHKSIAHELLTQQSPEDY